MEDMIQNWPILVALLAVAVAGGAAAYHFVKMPTDQQLAKVREWLLYAVTEAEKALGGGTGKLKLRYVYDMFVATFPWLVKVVSFELFSGPVDDALEEMRNMLASNKAVAVLVSGEPVGESGPSPWRK